MTLIKTVQMYLFIYYILLRLYTLSVLTTLLDAIQHTFIWNGTQK